MIPTRTASRQGPWQSSAGLGYCHTQRGLFHYLLYAIGAAMLVGAWVSAPRPGRGLDAAVGGGVLWFFAAAFHRMTVEDEVDCLTIRFGPVPLLRKSIRYADITRVEPDRTRVIDGWGIHHVLWRGTTYNIWGFACVKLTLGKKVIRIGTDDVQGLTEFCEAGQGRT